MNCFAALTIKNPALKYTSRIERNKLYTGVFDTDALDKIYLRNIQRNLLISRRRTKNHFIVQ
jgi:hypothetical protein